MIGQPSNPLIGQEEQKIQSAVQSQYQQILSQTLQSAMSLMYDPKRRQILMQHISASNNPVQDAATGAVRMMTYMQSQSGNKLPIQILVPGSVLLAMEYLDLVSKAGKTQITPQVIAHTVQAVGAQVMQMLKVTPEKMHQMIAQGKAKQAQGQPLPPAQSVQPKGIVASRMGAQ